MGKSIRTFILTRSFYRNTYCILMMCEELLLKTCIDSLITCSTKLRLIKREFVSYATTKLMSLNVVPRCSIILCRISLPLYYCLFTQFVSVICLLFLTNSYMLFLTYELCL